MTAADLRAFEARVVAAFEAKQVRGPVHLSGGNEEQLVDVFKAVGRDDWVFSTYRSHLHALLHGIDPEWLMAEIKAGRSMNIASRERRFFTSAIVAGCLPIATGVAAAFKRRAEDRRVWCFVGDMAATTGAFHEAARYAFRNDLPITFVIENNGLSCDSPTEECWGKASGEATRVERYGYERTVPHVGVGRFVSF